MYFNSICQLKSDPFFVEIQFEEQHDRGGLFQWLGTNGFRSTFINPLKLNLISVSISENSSNIFNNFHNLFVFRSSGAKIGSIKNFVSVQGPNSFLTIYLKHPFGVIPTKYCLGRPLIDEASPFCLINWQLMASVDGIDWVILHVHDNDRNLLESETGRYLWSLDIESSVVSNVRNQGWRMFKIQEETSISVIPDDVTENDGQEQYLSNDNNFPSPASSGFWLNYIEFYGTVFAISDTRQQEIKTSIDDYVSKFSLGTFVHPSTNGVFANNGEFITGKIISPIKNGSLLVEWDKEIGKSIVRHKMGAQGIYELSLSKVTNECLGKNNEHRPKTFTESVIDSKSSFEMRPEDIRYSFQDSFSWVFDPNISAPVRTSSMSSQKNNRFPSFFNKENLVETMANKEGQNIYKKRRDAIKDYQNFNTLIKSETEDMDLRYENSDEENLHLESTTVRSYIQSRMECLDGVTAASKPTIRFGEKYPTDEEDNIDELLKKRTKLPDESKKNFSLTKETKRKNSVGLSDGRPDALKIMDDVDVLEISDDSEYFEISQDASKFMKRPPKLESANEINKNKPFLDKNYYSSFTKNKKYKQGFAATGESSTKFKPVNIPHSFPGLVQCLDPKVAPHSSEIRSNIEILNYRMNKVPCKLEETHKCKYFGYDPAQFRMKLEIQIPVATKCNFNFQKSTDLDASGINVESFNSETCNASAKQSCKKETIEFVLDTESSIPIINYILSLLPAPDPILNIYPIECISQSWHSQLTLYYGFCDKTNRNTCRNCFFEEKLNEKLNNCNKTFEEELSIVNLLSCLKKIQSLINRKALAKHVPAGINDLPVNQVQWSDSTFISQQICKSLLNQLEDVWGLLSNDTLPSWVLEWPQKYPFIFSYEVRVDILNAYWLGSTRSIFWLQQRSRPNVDYVRPSFREEISSPFHFLGRLKKHIAHVPRPFYFGNTNVTESEARTSFWSAVKDLFNFHSENKEELEIQFESEEGTGLGPTLEFMNILSNEFMRIDTRMWIHSDTDMNYLGEFVHSKNGLFPYPWPLDKLCEDVLEKFHILGIFVAKCLQDHRRIDIPFSETFIKYLNDDFPEYHEDTYLEDFYNVYPMRGKFLKSLSQFCREKNKLVQIKDEGHEHCFTYDDELKRIAIETVGSTFEDLYLDMEFLPTSKVYGVESHPLIAPIKGSTDSNKNGKNNYNEPLTASNAEEYLKGTLFFAMNSGIEKQIMTMKDGFNKVFPIKSFKMFTTVELLHLLCGEQDIQWTLAELYQFTEPTQGYTISSLNFKNFLEVLEEMTQTERKIFMQFVTGCSSLPPGGLRNMKPRLTVAKKNAKDGGPYPSVNTCMHYLKLPEYQSKTELKSKLMDASSQQGFYLN